MQLLMLFISAFLIRLINLNQSLWLDESIVAKVVKTISFFQIPFQLSPSDVHPPLYYMFISLWTSIFGFSEIALRMPSVFFSLIAGWYVYKIGGKWAAVFFLFNPLIIYYSQEARMHMMATMFLSITLYYFLRLLLLRQAQDRNDKILFNIFSALVLFTFYGSGFFIAAMIAVGFFLFQKKQSFLYLSIGISVSLLFLSPLLYLQVLNSKAGLAELTNWSSALGNVDIKNVAMIFLKFATGRLSWLPKWSYYLVAGIPTAIIWIVALLGMKRNKICAYLFILPLIFGVIVSLWMPMMMYFRFLYLIPVMSIALAYGVNHNVKKYGILIIFLIFSLMYLFNPQFHREDWKGLSQTLKTQIPIYMIIPSSDPISYYRNDVSVFELRSINKATVPESIDVIPYTSEIYGLDYTEVLQKIGCVKESQSNFRGDVSVEKWKCLKNA